MSKFDYRTLDLQQLHRVVAIVFYGRSGSMFLSSLLDGHPHTFSIPGPFLVNYFDTFWKQYGFLPKEQLVECFIHYHGTMFDARLEWQLIPGKKAGQRNGFTTMGPNRDQTLWANRDVFRTVILELLAREATVTRRSLFQAVHVAYNAALGRKLATDRPLIVYQMHQPDWRARMVVEDFPEARFIHMVREPLQSLGSHFAHHYTEDKDVLSALLLGYLLDGVLLGGKALLDGYEDRSCAVRLEDLHRAPRPTLEAVASWLGLPWDDCLMQSTFNGLQWWNVDKSPQVSGFTTVTITKRHDAYYTEFDRVRLRALLGRKYRKWGYDITGWNDSTLFRLLILPLLAWPLKMEFLTWRFKAKEIDFGALNRPLYYAYIRLILLRAWLKSWGTPREELRLVSERAPTTRAPADALSQG